MSHEITVHKDGTAEMFAAGSTPVWHRIGQRVERALTSGAALQMAALDWKVDERPIYADIAGEMTAVNTHKSIVRRDTRDVLGVVGRKYRPSRTRRRSSGSTASLARASRSTRPRARSETAPSCGPS